MDIRKLGNEIMREALGRYVIAAQEREQVECDAPECIVSGVIDPQKADDDMCLLAMQFKSFDEYERAIDARDREKHRAGYQEAISDGLSSRQFNELARTLANPIQTINEHFTMKTIASVHAYLCGDKELEARFSYHDVNYRNDESEHLSAILLGHAVNAMKERGVFEGWQIRHDAIYQRLLPHIPSSQEVSV